jgi:hypothetical protein
MKFCSSSIRVAWIPLLIGASLACGGPSRHDTLLKEGQKAEKQEQWVQAAAIYQEACTLKPDDTATCERAQEMRDFAVDLRTYEARKLCDAGRLQECLTTLAPVRALKSKNRAKLLEVVNLAGALATKQCLASDRGRQELLPALAELRCLMGSREPLWEGDAFRAHYAARSRSVASMLIRRGADAASDAYGSRLGFLQAAACLAPLSDQHNQEGRTAQQAFATRAQTHFDLQYTANGTTRPARGTCLEIANKVGRGLTCEAKATPQAPLVIAAEVFSLQPRWKKTHQDRQEVVNYKAGTETLPNPDYERARVEYELADGRFREAERVTSDRESRCRETQAESDCDAFESAEDTSDDRERELNNARRRFHSEPATITRDIYKDHSYVVRTHRWVAPFRASIRVGSASADAEIADIIYTDSEQQGFAEAGVRADSFQPPSATYFRDESSRWLSERIEAQLLGELSRRARAKVDGCKGDIIDCWATASYWLGTTDLGLPLLQQLSTDKALPALECTAAHL